MGPSLPSKEQSQFRQLVKFYETKQYKKAQKTADGILKKFPNHGETLAMKGLVLNSVSKKEEAYELVKLGLKNDLKSHVCWHVYGLLYRSDRLYEDASRAYLQALRIDPENVQILRDLALLQIQTRHFEGFISTRRTLLTLKPGQKNNWIAFALANHVLKNYAEAAKIIDTYSATVVPGNDRASIYERGELQLYKNSILEENGDHDAALKHLERIKDIVVDRSAFLEARARNLLALERSKEAEEVTLELLERNMENSVYHEQYHQAVLSNEDVAEEDQTRRKIELYDELAKSNPKVLLPKRMPLDLLDQAYKEEFVRRLDSYVRWFLERGVPALSVDLKSLYREEWKVQAIEKLFTGYENYLKESGALPAVDSDVHSPVKLDNSRPAVLFWVMLFLAQHYDRIGDLDVALNYINRAIEHTPTVIEAFLVKAKILKHCGNLSAAAECADAARKMDLADRYLNTKCTKYNLRCNQVGEAEANIALFTRDGETRGVQALYDMQCMWFECEIGDAYIRMKRPGLALKNFKAVERHFEDMIEDQFDFHSYCLRKETMRSYVNLLLMEDEIRSSKYFTRAAKAAIRLHIDMHDNPQQKDGSSEQAAALANLSLAERKKAQSKLRKSQAKKAAAEEQKKKDKNGKADGKKGKGAEDGWMETDPHGTELLKGIKDHMVEAARLLRELEKYAPRDVETHELAFEVAIRRNKYLQALRAVNRAAAVSPRSSACANLVVRLRLEVEDNEEKISSALSEVREVISACGTRKIVGDRSLSEYVNEIMRDSAQSSETRLGSGMALLRIADNENERSRAVEVLQNLSGASFKTCHQIAVSLSSFAKKEDIESFKEAVKEKYPQCTVPL
uniref:Uncharacterized protein n=1 Tax=Rhodosorus marinus TaxID=101924 RepID=A0A7S2ZBR2_9RHOD|mmetsp:Transcript_13549/g.54323  ORF Transcript_13549/g.54323 Transcript_13549/m.54323 type:complete len:853 (+) Transcript_13549:189-2747(+)